MTSLKLASAQAILDHVLATADYDFSRPVAACVLDTRVLQLAAAAQDGVKPASVAVAYAKAVTALNYGRDTVEFRFRYSNVDSVWVHAGAAGWDDNDVANAMKVNPIFCCWAGASLILHPETDEVMGVVAVSGLAELEDHQVAASRPDKWLV